MKNLRMGLVFLLFLSASVHGVPPSALEGLDLRTGNYLKNEDFTKMEASPNTTHGPKTPPQRRVVIFLSARCPNSHAHLNEIKKLAEKHPEFPFVAIHSNADEPVAEALDYFKKQSLPFPVLHDKGSEIADQCKALKTPHAYVVDSDGRILYQGGVTDSANPEKAQRFYLREALKEIKQGHAVSTPEGRTLGCRMARAKEKKNGW